mmetsp:Transcript_102811/g.329759  ORF Transcript_102811/g.329759 Transcript_102811/m.329759 type:complete len:767 (-) Transcript_102811:41-2341(-)
MVLGLFSGCSGCTSCGCSSGGCGCSRGAEFEELRPDSVGHAQAAGYGHYGDYGGSSDVDPELASGGAPSRCLDGQTRPLLPPPPPLPPPPAEGQRDEPTAPAAAAVAGGRSAAGAAARRGAGGQEECSPSRTEASRCPSSASSDAPPPPREGEEEGLSPTEWTARAAMRLIPEARRQRDVMGVGSRVVVTASPLTGKLGVVQSFDRDGDPRVLLDGSEHPVCVLRGDVLPFRKASGQYSAIVDDGTERLGLAFAALPPGPIFVRSVVPGGWADKAGVLPGDELSEIAGQPVTDVPAEGFDERLRATRPLELGFFRTEEWGLFYVGEEVEVVVLDTGQWLPCTVLALGPKPGLCSIRLHAGGLERKAVRLEYLRPAVARRVREAAEKVAEDEQEQEEGLLGSFQSGELAEVVVLDTGHWLPCRVVGAGGMPGTWTVRLLSVDHEQTSVEERHLRRMPEHAKDEDHEGKWRKFKEHQFLKRKQAEEVTKMEAKTLLQTHMGILQDLEHHHERKHLEAQTCLYETLKNQLNDLNMMNEGWRVRLQSEEGGRLWDPHLDPVHHPPQAEAQVQTEGEAELRRGRVLGNMGRLDARATSGEDGMPVAADLAASGPAPREAAAQLAPANMQRLPKGTDDAPSSWPRQPSTAASSNSRDSGYDSPASGSSAGTGRPADGPRGGGGFALSPVPRLEPAGGLGGTGSGGSSRGRAARAGWPSSGGGGSSPRNAELGPGLPLRTWPEEGSAVEAWAPGLGREAWRPSAEERGGDWQA